MAMFGMGPTLLPTTTITARSTGIISLPEIPLTAGVVSLGEQTVSSTALGGAPVPGGLGTTLSFIDSGGALRLLVFDATIKTVHTGTAEVSEHPIDAGGTVTDHVTPGQRRITIEAEVTNTPIGDIGGKVSSIVQVQAPELFKDYRKGAQASASEFGHVLAAPVVGTFAPFAAKTLDDVKVKPAEYVWGQSSSMAQVMQFTQPFDRVVECFQALDQLRATGTLVRVDSKMASYTQCLITAVSAPEDVMDACTFLIELVEINLVEAGTTAAQARTVEPRAKTPSKVGVGGVKFVPTGETAAKQGSGLGQEVLQEVLGSMGDNVRP